MLCLVCVLIGRSIIALKMCASGIGTGRDHGRRLDGKTVLIRQRITLPINDTIDRTGREIVMSIDQLGPSQAGRNRIGVVHTNRKANDGLATIAALTA